VAAGVRNAVLSLISHIRPVDRAIASQQAELMVRYRDGRLSVQDGRHHHGAAHAGDHAPDPEGLRRPDDTPVAVEELQTRPGFLLLVRGAHPATVEELRRTLGDLGTVVGVAPTAAEADDDGVVDADDVVGRAYGLGTEGLALVRPDGYLGLVADTADPGVVRRYLEDVLRVTGRVAA